MGENLAQGVQYQISFLVKVVDVIIITIGAQYFLYALEELD
jgi:hypothetical protein